MRFFMPLNKRDNFYQNTVPVVKSFYVHVKFPWLNCRLVDEGNNPPTRSSCSCLLSFFFVLLLCHPNWDLKDMVDIGRVFDEILNVTTIVMLWRTGRNPWTSSKCSLFHDRFGNLHIAQWVILSHETSVVFFFELLELFSGGWMVPRLGVFFAGYEIGNASAHLGIHVCTLSVGNRSR